MSVQSVLAKIKLIKVALNLTSNASSSISRNNTSELAVNWTPKYYDKFQENSTLLNATIIFFYALIIIVSLFGNIIVCKIVFTGSSKKSTTNLYIGNLSISDLMMTILNIPLELTEILCRNWPLGFFLCKCLPLFRGMSVSASTLTLAFIALDRFQVIAHPLKPRPSYKTTIYKIVLIWFTAFILSFPYSLMSHVTNELTYEYVIRCEMKYPSPDYKYRQIFTLIALGLQFAGPLTISIIIYVKICLIIWNRKSIGSVTLDQQIYQREAKWKTIKMLVIVLITFVICWLPMNIYHTYQDARGETDFRKHNSIVWLICDWFAMSSVCCNPFIYCWLNDKFRKVAKSHLQWILSVRRIKSQKKASHFLARSYKMQLTVSRNTNSSLKFSTFSSQSREFHTVGYEKQLSIHATTNDENSNQTLSHETSAKTTGDAICRSKQSPNRNNLTQKHYLFKEKRYKNSTEPETFV
ncbi:G-protein coupled receptor 83-like [Argiope bruennichi]|uniref:Putative G-protein coupled receptor 83 like protein n=1 Tax=Argiope bruennichi TaxID=94029 RepID=A0A8T0FLT0_ARGBR|nr:G-protein coupled receptor 83-like [Argiope bruennichi]KAF8791462.1 putative G-protein coupled receptor 83 like protein [Argiope bruennichi]